MHGPIPASYEKRFYFCIEFANQNTAKVTTQKSYSLFALSRQKTKRRIMIASGTNTSHKEVQRSYSVMANCKVLRQLRKDKPFWCLTSSGFMIKIVP
jgi:hypothetical protein